MADLGPILTLFLAIGLLLALSLRVRRSASRSVPAAPTRPESPSRPLPEPAAGPDAILHAAHETIDEIELARVRSMLQRR